jgi:hypothetical protein
MPRLTRPAMTYLPARVLLSASAISPARTMMNLVSIKQYWRNSNKTPAFLPSLHQARATRSNPHPRRGIRHRPWMTPSARPPHAHGPNRAGTSRGGDRLTAKAYRRLSLPKAAGYGAAAPDLQAHHRQPDGRRNAIRPAERRTKEQSIKARAIARAVFSALCRCRHSAHHRAQVKAFWPG